MSAHPETLDGGCHCGNLSFRLETATPPEGQPVRACGCGFCRLHGVLSTSDPAGRVSFQVRDPERLSRYQFGLKAADFLICRECGVYVAAFMSDPDDVHGFATLMSVALDDRARFPPPQPAVYEVEDAAGRRQRRRERWTPARLEIS